MMIEYLCQIETNLSPVLPLTSSFTPYSNTYPPSHSAGIQMKKKKINYNNTNYNNSVLDLMGVTYARKTATRDKEKCAN